MPLSPSWNDTLDHLITAMLAVIFSVGLFIIYLKDGTVPEWGGISLGTILGFYFRGRVNGSYNASQMTKIEKVQDTEKRMKKLEERVEAGDEG